MPAIVSLVSPTIIELTTTSVLLGVLAIAVYTDLRRGYIYNKLTYTAAIAGLAINVLGYGLDGGLSSVKGWLLGAALFFVFFLFKAMGAGDVKLLAAVGAIKGPVFVLNAFVFTGLAGGVIGIFILLRRRRVRAALGNLASELHGLVLFQRLPDPDQARMSSLGFPYGPAIALGSLAALVVSVL